MRIHKGILAVSALGLFVGALQACATDVVDVVDEDSGVTPPQDASKADTSTNRPDTSVPPRDTGTPDTSRPDTGTPDTSTADAADGAVASYPGDQFDPAAPKPGDNCPTGVNVNDVITRRCGRGGSQSALCEAGRKVGAYGACLNETGECLINEVSVAECGFCGQEIKKCDAGYKYITGACINQVAGGCTKNEVTYLETLCPTATDVRRQVCSAACVKGTPEACAPRPIDEITVSQTAGTTVNGNFSTTSSLKLPLLTGTSCPAAESATISSLYHWVRLKNTGAQEVTIAVSNGLAPTARPAVTFAAYPAAAVAAIPADRKACGSVTTSSPEKLTITIPANSSVMLHTMLDTSTASVAKLNLEVKTNFVGPEPAPTPQYIVDVGPNMGDIVNQAIAFTPDTIVRPNGLLGLEPCPLSLSSSETSFSYIRINNPGAANRTVTLATTGGTDTVLAYYNGVAPTSAMRLACTGNWIEDGIDETLTGVIVPAASSITVYVGRYSGTGGTSNLRATTTN